jgi:alkylation response protein AidB-like acyl-CoA dehydrogenase
MRHGDDLVLLESTSDGCERLAGSITPVASFHGGVLPALEWAVDIGRWAPTPGRGETRLLWEVLASTAAIDVGVARVLEPHLDALAILDQATEAGSPADLGRIGAGPDSSWGVYAAEGPGVRVTATPDADAWLLDGVKPWCSLAAHVSHALVTAHIGGGGRRLFAVNMRGPGVEPAAGPWVSRGLSQVVSAPVRFEHATAVPVGPDEWYLTRPGFAWGGAGVAACWWGGAVGVGRAVVAAARSREPDQLALAHLGAIDTALAGARATLAEAARLIDTARDPGSSDTPPTTAGPAVLARRARNVVATAAETVLTRVGHALGPAPLTVDEEHARRVADLQVYLRQHHAERDEASQGRDLIADGGWPW